MRITLTRLCGVLALTLLFSMLASADTFAVGYVSWDVNTPGTAGEFDILNLTGAEALPPSFPITTLVNLSSLSLTVHFSDGSTVVEPSSYFSLSSDLQSFDGTSIGIGGVNPTPTSATLTGSFTPTTIDVSGVGTETVTGTFSSTISDSPTLVDGDLAIIYATTSTTSSVPEPGSWVLLGTILAGIALSRRERMRTILRKAPRAAALTLAVVAACSLAALPAHAATVTLSASTAPSSGVAGINNVNITANGWPAGDTNPAHITVTWATSCGGAAAATDSANTVKVILGATERVNVNIPGSLHTGTYYVQVTDSTGGDTDFTSSNCSEAQVTGSSTALACVPASSLGVVAPLTGPAAVYAVVPNGSWCCSAATGVGVIQLETGGGPLVPPAAVPLPDYINSCAGNPVTGDAVCVANSTNVYHIRGVGTFNTFTSLTSGATGYSGFSGGECENCGVAVNANGNFAVITEGVSGSPSGSGLQTLFLATDTFGSVFPTSVEVSENIAIDPNRGLVLSADESNYYDLVGVTSSGALGPEYTRYVGGVGEMDSSTTDCSTGIALAPYEFTNYLYLADLTQATFFPGSPGSWTAPSPASMVASLVGSYSAGLSGSAVAPGGQHVAVVTGEFGGSSFAILKLPATSGGPISLPDYAYVNCVDGFSAGYDPHTVTAYVSPNNGKSYALFSNVGYGTPSAVLQADMVGILGLPRAGDGHTVLGDPDSCLSPGGTVGSTVMKYFAPY